MMPGLRREQKNAVRRWALGAVLGAAIGAAGCAQPSVQSESSRLSRERDAGAQRSDAARANRELDLRLVSGKKAAIGDDVFDFNHLARKLRSHGAREDTTIRIDIPEDTPPAVLTEVALILQKAGYRRIIFARPRKVDSMPAGPATAGDAALEQR
jgi:hypothetical protein